MREAFQRIKLEREWVCGKQIGSGGFGKVFEARTDDCQSAVAKFVDKTEGAQRDLLVVNLDDARNTIPILEHGEIQDYFVLIMPRAEKSLRQYLKEKNRPLSVSKAIQILTDVANTLADLDGKVVHRDIKPENILLYRGTWCLTDFGISRYADATTASDTWKYAKSVAYAAPERWREERAKTATDIYSLGVITYELLSGSPPFLGPEPHDYRDQHLHHAPPDLKDVQPALATLVNECLYKAPEARPSPADILKRLNTTESLKSSGGLHKLQLVNYEEVSRQAQRTQQESIRKSEVERMTALFNDARKELKEISFHLKSTIANVVSTATVTDYNISGWKISLGNATIEFTDPLQISIHPWKTGEHPVFDVVGYAYLSITQPEGALNYKGRSHSIWFCDAEESGRFKWFETAFMLSPWSRKRSLKAPFDMDPCKEASEAFGMVIGKPFEVAWPFTPLVVGELDDFIDRWAGWFADAVQGNLYRPQEMPEHATGGTWRKK